MKERDIPLQDIKTSARFWGHVARGVGKELEPHAKVVVGKMIYHFRQNLSGKKGI